MISDGDTPWTTALGGSRVLVLATSNTVSTTHHRDCKGRLASESPRRRQGMREVRTESDRGEGWSDLAGTIPAVGEQFRGVLGGTDTD